jgi:hypothetical protein
MFVYAPFVSSREIAPHIDFTLFSPSDLAIIVPLDRQEQPAARKSLEPTALLYGFRSSKTNGILARHSSVTNVKQS